MTTSNRTDTHQLVIKGLFDGLTHREKLYAHYLARAAWYGSRIILRQTSPEGTGIFDFILELHKACEGQWTKLVDQHGVSPDDLGIFLEFSAMFLSNLGNYFASNPRNTSLHHLLIFYRERETARLSHIFLPKLFATWLASRPTQLLLWTRSSTLCYRTHLSVSDSPTGTASPTTILEKNKSPRRTLLPSPR